MKGSSCLGCGDYVVTVTRDLWMGNEVDKLNFNETDVPIPFRQTNDLSGSS